MVRYIEAKTILSKFRGVDSFFGITYNMNLYRGCQHGCIYCDTRSECYGVGDISAVSVKSNAIELLRKELASKRIKGTIGTGSMNDPYMPVEEELQMTRKALAVVAAARFPVHVITKGELVSRDVDLLQEIGKTYVAVSFTITTAEDRLSQRIEPGAPVSSIRFKAMELLAKNGIYTGVTLMPLLPYINDTEKNILEILQRAKDSGASYVMPMYGFTMRKGSREYLYECFDRDFPDMKSRYEALFGEQYICNSPNARALSGSFRQLATTLNMPDRMKFYEPPKQSEQLSLF